MLITNFGTIPSQGGLMLPNWSYGKKIVIPANSIDADLTNFPCTVILNSTNFDFSKAKSDGSDIRFTDKNLNFLKHERAEHSQGTQFAKYNVLLPTVSDLTDTEFYMWYGNPNAYNTSIESWQDMTGKQLTYNGNVKMAYNSTYGRRVASFDGNGDYFTIADSDDWIFSSNNFCIENSVVFNSLSTNMYIFRHDDNTSSNVFRIDYYAPDKKIQVYGLEESATKLFYEFQYIFVIGTTYNISIGRNGTSIYCKINDNTITPFVSTAVRNNSLGNIAGVVKLGTDTGGGGFLNGYLLGTRITNGRSRVSETSPSQYTIDGSDVVFCTNFDTIYDQNYAMVQHMGDSLVDATGNGNNGTATGTTVVSTEYGKVRQFDGVDDKITTALFTNTDNVTLTVMATKAGTGGTDLLFYVGTSGTNGYGLYTNSLKFSLKARSTFADTTVSNTTTPQVVTLTRTNGTWTAIIDGISYAVTNLSVTTPTGATYFGGNTTDYYDGQLSNARYSTVARSQAYTKAEQKALKNTLLTITRA